MKFLALAAFTIALAIGAATPAKADTGYFIVDFQQHVLAGPYATWSTCEKILGAYQLAGKAMCQQRVY